MRTNHKKMLALGMSMAMVVSSLSISNIAVRGDMTIAQMVSNAQYNLALGKNITANPTRQEGSEKALSDGQFKEHAATTFGAANTYYEIDLGAVYDASTLDKLVVSYKEKSDGDTPINGYQIRYSANGLDYTTVKSITGTSVKAQITTENLLEEEDISGVEGAVRFIRLVYPNAYTWGIQANEIAILDTDQNKAFAEVDECADAKGVTVSSEDYNQVSYEIEAGENQDGFKYLVYLVNNNGSKLIGNGVEAGKKYTVDSVVAGTYTLKVVACYDGAASKGIESERVSVADMASLVQSKRNVANTAYSKYGPQISDVKTFYNGHTITTAQKAVDGKLSTGEGSEVALRTAAGSPQYFVINLGEYYTPSEMQEVILAYTNANTYASDAKIEFSFDGENYVKVGTATGYKFSQVENNCALSRVKLNKLANYTEKAVRFVKVTLSGGVSAWGYVVNEVGVIANTDAPTVVGSNIPEAADVTVEQRKLEEISYQIIASEGQEDATYQVLLGTKVINKEAKAGTIYTYSGVASGDYDLKICTVEDGWLSKGITKKVTVEGYVDRIETSLNLALVREHSEVTVTTDADNKTYEDLEPKGPIGQDISGGVGCVNDGIWWNHSHHTGYLQTRPDRKLVNVEYDLGKDYQPTDIHSIISAYSDAGTAATKFEIFFSADGQNYESVYKATNAQFEKFMVSIPDVSKYTQESVRYIKYQMQDGPFGLYTDLDKNGNPNWSAIGYLLCELAVMGDERLLPEKVMNVEATSDNYNEITVNWTDVAQEDCVYTVYLDGVRRGLNIEKGVGTVTFLGISAGTHKVKVASVANGMVNYSKEVSVVVTAEPTTAPPKTEKPTTVKPETTKPVVTKKQEVTTKKAPVVKVAPSKVKKIKVSKRKATILLSTVKGASGYEIRYSLKKNMKNKKTKTVTTPKAEIKKLKSKKVYFFSVRTFKKVRGKVVYSAWSKPKKSKKIK